MGGSNREFFPPLASLLAPENCRYHTASKVVGSQICGSPYSGSNRMVVGPKSNPPQISLGRLLPSANSRTGVAYIGSMKCLNLALRRCRRILQAQTFGRSTFNHKLQDLPKSS
jgi:hypothetical protein